MKITIKQMKQMIADQAKDEYQHIINQFCEPGETPEEDLKECIRNKATDPKQWQFRGKMEDGMSDECADFTNEFMCMANSIPKGSKEYCFDCTPFDDQLRAYVFTSSDQTQVLRINIQGE